MYDSAQTRKEGDDGYGVRLCKLTELLDRLPGLNKDLKKAAWLRELAGLIESDLLNKK